ncbi:acyltransferase [Fibrobacter sp. UWB7]|uniref:acyltransferase n=1 Tax=Fibrobacter sp. UWB7 TaxID=1896206 RepID=UPI000917F248|nr:acyltransferase [Fibrobacter sp. UWB7]SHM78589.1 Hexapeptide repeat of succinyl-transferase [Fibrobacter sp. UWB7]
MIYHIYKAIRLIFSKLTNVANHCITWLRFKGNNVSFSSFKTGGTPYVMVARGGKMSIGKNFAMNNGIKHNPIGCSQPCTFFVDRTATLSIGDNVGISQAALVAIDDITIGNNVKIGGGVCIYTTDFHSLDPLIRKTKDDMKNRAKKPVAIKDNAFIGARSIILKGVTVGENSIVGAGSVVTKSIPDNQIWAGNPARFIRNV